jgi:hypothetical protein
MVRLCRECAVLVIPETGANEAAVTHNDMGDIGITSFCDKFQYF